jgi:hypothetical protein
MLHVGQAVCLLLRNERVSSLSLSPSTANPPIVPFVAVFMLPVLHFGRAGLLAFLVALPLELL